MCFVFSLRTHTILYTKTSDPGVALNVNVPGLWVPQPGSLMTDPWSVDPGHIRDAWSRDSQGHVLGNDE